MFIAFVYNVQVLMVTCRELIIYSFYSALLGIINTKMQLDIIAVWRNGSLASEHK